MEKTYYIYHIIGVKIGCSTNPNKRVTDQGHTNFEILEQHIDIDIASSREKELQKQYGYKVDRNSYKIAVENRPKLTNEIRAMGGKAGYRFTKEDLLKGSKAGGKTRAESGALSLLGKITGSKIRNCPYCNRELKGGGAYNSHTKKCKTING